MRDRRPDRRATVILLAAVAVLSGCSSKPASGTGSLTPPFLETPVAARPAATAALAVKGKQVYEANCVQCHGVEGKGDGYGAPFPAPGRWGVRAS